MKPTPPGWPRLSIALFYEDPARAIDWLVEAFGFEVRLRVEGLNGRIEHSELEYGEALVMVGGAGAQYQDEAHPWRTMLASPQGIGGKSTANPCLHIDDADGHCARARAAGAQIVYEPKTTDYGADYWADRSYAAVDPEGHLWWFMQRVRTKGESR
jgi:uncharacterized glyoxalase superfamily protein PhnB